MKQTIQHACRIYRQDLLHITTNWVVAVIIGGLIFLPSLYAWLNIYASMDPYAQTSHMKIAIVNEDTGTTIQNQHIVVGDEVVQTLQTNESFTWSFLPYEQALQALKNGDYFAVIVIPNAFSTQLSSILTDMPTKAHIDYYVNEKINPIAPKITSKGASVLTQQISSEFISTVNGTLFSIFNTIGVEIEHEVPDFQKFEHYLFTIDQRLPEIETFLTQVAQDGQQAETLLNHTIAELPAAKAILANGLTALQRAVSLMNDTEALFNQLMPTIQQDLQSIQSIQQPEQHLQALQTILQAHIEAHQQLGHVVQSLLQQRTSLDTATVQQLEQLNTILQTMPKLSDALATLQQLNMNQAEDISTLLNKLQEQVLPQLRNTFAHTKELLTKANAILQQVQQSLPDAINRLLKAQKMLTTANQSVSALQADFPAIRAKIQALTQKIQALEKEMSITDLVQLLKNDVQAEQDFFAEPIQLKEHQLFPIANYGTAMTPFYTVLAIWVGCLLLISLLAVNLPAQEHISVRAIYFGRLLTFLTLSLLQTFIITVGDCLLLNNTLASPLYFILFGLLISFVFITVVYTLVSVFGNVGKALAIVMLVLQIAGSGGTYPIELLPPFFQAIHPFLPFTYAISLLREAVGGIIWTKVSIDCLLLISFWLFFLLMGVFFKQLLRRKMELFMNKTHDSNLFH
ncbi:YhgE/Pip domain-containing protein [Lysinibacillus piscis]|uniref:Phage infection protein n=1 Tax=Lysinibacillus piscis TaxID=2518931 RepID=A0ABQ5NKL4_9BACI|nr:YhgE/Pip domain-containing protein [Lysinibacillus sp. KH24]GLC88612.1 phage infection protein [Lysinibacillus sp. KH24]